MFIQVVLQAHPSTQVLENFNMVYRIRPIFHDSLFDHPMFFDLTRDIGPARNGRGGSYASTVVPRYSRRAGSDAVYFDIEMPGVNRDDVKVEIDSNVLIVKGRRYRTEKGGCSAEMCQAKEGEGDSKKAVVVQKYLLTYRLGSRVDAEGIKADHCGNGILAVTVPIKAREVRKIEIA